MAQSDIQKMLEFSERNKLKRKSQMKFDSGNSAGIYSRGSVLIAEWKVLLSLKVSLLCKVFTHIFL